MTNIEWLVIIAIMLQLLILYASYKEIDDTGEFTKMSSKLDKELILALKEQITSQHKLIDELTREIERRPATQ